jgi:hypothetical protein
MSKPIYDFDTLNTPIWEPSSNAIEHILSILPTYDYEFMDIISHKPHDDNMITISEFLFRTSKILLDKQMIKADKDGILTYKEGTYTMVYKVYYPNNPHTYTLVNDYPISTYSSRGTNYIYKSVKTPFLFKMYSSHIEFSTSAPIEVVSYTFTEK